MALDAIAQLPTELLDWFGVMTHLHPGGNSECSGQQTISDITTVLQILGVKTGIITPHTGNPGNPYLLDQNGVEMATLKEIADEVQVIGKNSHFDLRFGLECNTVPEEEWERRDYLVCELDTSDEMIASLGSTYTIGSLHGDTGPYKSPNKLMDAVVMLCQNPAVDSLGHITRYVSIVEINWLNVCQMAAKSGTLIELNLNLWFKELGQNKVKDNDSFDARFHRGFMENVAKSGAKVVLGIDAHNLGMFPQTSVTGGWETTIERCLAFVDAITDAGITQDQVVSASTTQWDEFFSVPKSQRS